MLVSREPENQGDVEEQGDAEEQGNDNNATEEPVTDVNDVEDQSIQSPTPLTLPPQQPQDIPSTSQEIEEVKVVVPSTRRRRGVVIRNPEEESSTKTPTESKSKDKGKGIMVEEPKPMKKKQQVELDEAYARK
nr:hypothetical protein [Tanacetum cinerariifolium]